MEELIGGLWKTKGKKKKELLATDVACPSSYCNTEKEAYMSPSYIGSGITFGVAIW